MSITLYDYWRSSASYRLRIALNLLDIPYDRVVVDLSKGRHKDPENLSRNPQGLVPTLDIDGVEMTQSLAVVEYLNETHSAGLLPGDPKGRARVRAISYAIAMEIHPVCNVSVARFATENSGGTLAMKDWMQAFIPKGLAAVELMLDHPSTGRFSHGDHVTMADICLVPQLYNAARWECDLSGLNQINAVANRLCDIDAFAAAHPDLNT